MLALSLGVASPALGIVYGSHDDGALGGMLDL